MDAQNKRDILDVLNSLEIVEQGSEGFILVENTPEVHKRLNDLNVSSDEINNYGDSETFCIIALAFTQGYATDYTEQGLVYTGE